MARPTSPRAPESPRPEPETHIVGLRKLGPGRYCVVSGTLAVPVVNPTTDPLEYAAEGLQLAIQAMLRRMP